MTIPGHSSDELGSGAEPRAPWWRAKRPADVTVDVVIPVLNEAHVLESSVTTVHDYFSRHVPYRWRIVIAENGSTDGTAGVAAGLCRRMPSVTLHEIGLPGRGRALRRTWMESDADIVCYTDVDLSTRLDAFLQLFDALIAEGYDVAVGSRLLPQSETTRSWKRQMISVAYNRLLRLVLGVGFSDAQTGFKALTRDVVTHVLPLVQDESWFLDTELLVLAEKLGYRIADIPIVWVEDDDSRVKIVRTAWDDLQGVWRLRRVLQENPRWLRESAQARRTERESAVR